MAGTLTISTLSDGTNSTSATNCIQGSAKAWVNFQGGNGNTAGVIIGSYNVSSITVNSSYNFSVNFTNALADTNYSVCSNTGFNSTSNGGYTNTMVFGNRATSSFYLFGVNAANGASSAGQSVYVSVFR